MSQYCQFCDKEMALEESIVYVKEYITCGQDTCVKKAKETAQAIRDEYLNKPKTQEAEIIVFSTKTPDDDNSWKAVDEEDYPMWFQDPDIIGIMLEGKSVYIEDEDLHYGAMRTKDYVKRLNLSAPKENE